MTDYSEHGAIPVEDAAVPNPPTVDEVLARQRELEAEAADASSEDGATQDDGGG